MENGKNSFIRPEFLKPQLSTKLYRATFSYLKRFHSESIFSEICAELKMPREFLLTEGNWVSVEFGARFAAKVREKTNDPEIYRKIGRYYLSPENISPFEYTIVKNMSPFLMLNSIRQFSKKSNKVCQISIQRHSLSKLTFEMKSEVPVYSDMALNTLGITEAFKDLYDLSEFKVDLKTDGQDSLSTYSITVQFSAIKYYVSRLRALGKYLLFGLIAGVALAELSQYAEGSVVPILTTLVFIGAVFLKQLSENLKTLRGQSEVFDERVHQKNVEVYQKAELLERRYQEANLLKDLAAQLVACRDSREVINKTLTACKEQFHYDRAAIFLHSRDRGVLSLFSSVGFDKFTEMFGKLEFLYPNPDARDGFIASVLERGETGLIIDVETYKTQLKPQFAKLLDILGTGSLLISPIQSGEQKYGVLVIVRGVNETLLSLEDRFLIENITSQLSLYFESAALYENESRLRHIFQQYVPPPVLEQVITDDYRSSGRLTPKRSDICSVFMDLRGFTSASENLPPEKVFDLINIFARFATKHLAKYDAILDNIIGDEIVSFFLPNSSGIDPAIRAMSAVNELTQNFPQFLSELSSQGFPHLRLGIGVHHGPASIGSVGSDHKMNFTALGSTVNTASRMQSLTKEYGSNAICVIASKAALQRVTNINDRQLEETVLRGTTEPTQYAVIGPAEWKKIAVISGTKSEAA